MKQKNFEKEKLPEALLKSSREFLYLCKKKDDFSQLIQVFYASFRFLLQRLLLLLLCSRFHPRCGGS